jgi:hypothetical protein
MSSNTSLAFGAGVLVGTPAGGSPIQFGTLQEVSVDFSFSTKQLMGQFQFPVAAARGSGKITGSAKFANIDGPTLNQIFFGVTPTTGQKLWSYNEAATAPAAGSGTFTGSIPAGSTALTTSAGTPVIGAQFTGTNVLPGTFIVSGSGASWVVNQEPTIAVSAATCTMVGEGFAVANAATFDANLGLSYAASGLQLVQVSGVAPTAGQYLVSGGVYSLSAADAAKAFLATYSYTQSVKGSKSLIVNPLMGVAPTFQIDFYDVNPNIVGAQWSLRLYSCLSSKLNLASKLEDFTIPQMDFEAFANASNNIGEINTAV